jgi:hypothetical protein
MRKRLGCLSPSGIVAAVLTLVAIALVSALWGGRPFSPGPLNAESGPAPVGGVASHAGIGGRCAACHPAPWSAETVSTHCLACHLTIEEELAGESGLHGALAAEDLVLPCYECHPEHRGAEAPLTVVDSQSFPHAAVGFSLQEHGAMPDGRPFACTDCHDQAITAFDAAICSGCHRDLDPDFMEAHTQAFGPGCLACHDGTGSLGADFDHDRLAFGLQGQHAIVACTECHAGARSLADLRAAPQECVACHEDPDYHAGLFGSDCAGCHTTGAWSPANYDRRHDFPIDHGEEGRSSCQTCHPDDLATYTCYGCHEHERTEIEEEHREEGILDFEDCVRCHPTGREDEAEEEDD